MRSHGDDTQQVVTDLSATQTQPMRVLHHGCNHRIIQFMHAREFGARVDQKPQAAFAGACPDNRLASQRRVVPFRSVRCSREPALLWR